MLLLLAQWLSQDVRGFNVFNYITLRTVLAAMTALIISFMAGPRVIRWLTAKKIGQAGRPSGRAPDASGQIWYPNHGWRVDSDCDWDHDPAVGRSVQSLCVGHADCHDRLWCHRVV